MIQVIYSHTDSTNTKYSPSSLLYLLYYATCWGQQLSRCWIDPEINENFVRPQYLREAGQLRLEHDRKKRMAQKAIRNIAYSQGQRTEAKRPEELFVFNQFEEMTYG